MQARPDAETERTHAEPAATPAEARTLHVGAIATPIHRDEDPAQIGRYRVMERLGQGGMGVVYAAHDPALDRKVAIKLMRGESDPDRLHRSQHLLRREAQALARLAHPNIVAIHDVGVHAGQVFVAMEFVAGRTMRTWWQEERPGWQAVVAAMVQAGRGIIAAHEAGLVHRDIKPDNLLLGDDGRVRVADFGIAHHDASAILTRPLDAGVTRDLATIAGRGAIVGSPAYMPPEQHEGGEVGPYSDLFSFCVTLWEGLYGERPFVGESSELPVLIRAGAPRRPAGAPDLPAWLDRALRRGLAPRPEDRWPSMQALLDELALDFVARRARLRARLLYATLVLLGALALLLGGRALQARWAREAAEQAAAARLLAVNHEVAGLLARGLRSEAEETLRAFVDAPELRDTSAAIDAWLVWADHMDALGDLAAAQAAVVEAYTALPDGDSREPSIALRIARHFHGAWKYDELAALGEQVAGRWPDIAGAAEWATLRADAARARGDLAGLLALIDRGATGSTFDAVAPVLRALAPTRCPLEGTHLVLPTDWPGAPGPELAIASKTALDRPHGLDLRRMDADLTPIGPDLSGVSVADIDPVAQPLVRTPDGPAYIIGYAPAPTKEIVLYELGRDAAREVLRWPDDPPSAVAVIDLDGDGEREIYLGTSTYTRKFYRLAPDAQGVWHRRPAHPPTDAMGSDIRAIVPGDFDGDGRDELAVSVGAWRAFEVRIFEANDRGELEVVVRQRFGHVPRMLALRAADGSTLLALTKDDTARSKDAWAPGEPQGQPAGVHIVRRRGDALVPVAYFPWSEPAGARAPTEAEGLHAGDLDGDGLMDLAVAFDSGSPFAEALILRQLPDGGFAPIVLGRTYPTFVGNSDGDPAAELFATLGRPDSPRICILGGQGSELAAPPRPHAGAEAPALVDPALARTWARTESLAGFGLYADAARALERRAALGAADSDRRALRRRAAELHEAAGDSLRAGERFAALAAEGDGAAALRAVAALEDALRLADALKVARAALDREGLTPAQRAQLARATQRLAANDGHEARFELRFDGPLDPGWRIEAPLALRRDPVRDQLIVDTTSDQALLASLPIELTGDPVALELDLDVERGEWGTEFLVQVRALDGAPVVEAYAGSGGGGGYLVRNHGIEAWEIAAPTEPSSHRTRATLFPRHRRLLIEERGDHPAEARLRTDRTIRPGPHELVLRTSGSADFASQRLRARIRRIALTGARPAATTRSPSPAADAALALIEGRLHDLLAAPSPPGLLRGVALAELGRGAEAIGVFAALDLEDPALRRELVRLLQTRLPAFAPLLRAALGPRYPPLLLEALHKKGEYPDDELIATRLAATADLEALPTSGEAGVVTRVGLLALRGGAWMIAGEHARAEADLTAAAALREGALTTDTRDATLATIELRRAELAALRDREADALAAARRALRRALEPSVMAERLRISPFLARWRDEPGWRALLAEFL